MVAAKGSTQQIAVAGIALSLGFGITACGGPGGAAELPNTTNAQPVYSSGHGDDVENSVEQKPEARPDGKSNDELAQFAISGYEAAQNRGDMIKVDLAVACAVEQRHGVTSPLPPEESYAILGPDLNAIGSQTSKASVREGARLIQSGTDSYDDALMSVYNSYNKAHSITACQAVDQINARP